MRNGTFAFVAVVLVVVSSLGGYYVRSATSNQTVTMYQSGPCSSPVTAYNATGMVQAFQVFPGSVGLVCVDYRFNSAGSYSFAPPNFGPLTNSEFSSCSSQNRFNGSVAASCSTIGITSSSAPSQHSAGQTISVVYTIQVGKNASGLFWLFIGNCDPVTLAVGALPSTIFSPGFLNCVTVVGAPSSESVTGVSNINVALVPTG